MEWNVEWVGGCPSKKMGQMPCHDMDQGEVAVLIYAF